MKRYLFLLLLFALGVGSWAAPLKNVKVQLTQPDGQVINCFASGDEFYNYVHDANGFTIVKGDNGYYCYATKDAQGKIVASPYIVGSVDPASVGLKPNTLISKDEYAARRHEFLKHIQQPQSRNGREINHGRYNNLVVFIRFNGDTYHTTPFSTVTTMFNADGYEDVSLHNFNHHNSYNKLDLWSYFYPEPDGQTLMSYEDLYTKEYYEPYDASTNPMGYHENQRAEREFALLERAIAYVEDMVPDTLDLDYNDDGLVDNVVFVVKGQPGPWSSLLWPHRWSIYDRYVPLHNLQVFDFNFQLEQGGYFNVSTLCHEMSHSLGSPDLYHYSGGNDPVGPWDLMCSNTEPPQNEGVYMKYKYGHWVDEIPDITNQPGVYELESVAWEGNRRNGYKIRTNDPNQFYVVEYRDKNRFFDTEVPGSGLLVYRIDTRFDGNAGWDGVNNFDEVYIFRPGGDYYNLGNINQANFSANAGRTEFDFNTDPFPYLTNGNVDNEFHICDISETGDRIRFTYRPHGNGDGAEPGPRNFIVNVNRDAHQVEFSWDPDEYADSYNVYCDGVVIANQITETSFAQPYTDADKGYHVYGVASLTGGVMFLLSAITEEWAILGEYETIHIDLTSESPYGTKGGEVEVSFNNPLMKTQYLTVYQGHQNETDLYVPANTEVTFKWLHGFDAESRGIHLTAKHFNEHGSGVIFDANEPDADFTTTYTVSDAGYSAMPPKYLWATPEGSNIRVKWAVQAENNGFNVYRNGCLKYQEVTANELLDEQVLRSGTHRYHVAGVAGDIITMDSTVTAHALMLLPYCEPPQNLQGTHQANGVNELTWEAPEFVGYGLLAYDDNIFEKAFGSTSQKWGIKFEPEQLDVFDGRPLTHLEMFDCSEGVYTFKIYNGETPNNSSLVYTQQQTMNGTRQWVRFALADELEYDKTMPLWIGVQSSGVTNPIPCCEYVGEDNSCLIIAGSSWRPCTFYGVYSSWMLHAFVKPADATRDFTYRLYWGEEEATDGEMVLGMDGLAVTNAVHNSMENMRYNVTAVWNGRETEFSNSVFLGPSVEVSESLANQGLEVFPNPTNSVLTVQGRDIEHIAIYNTLGQKVMEQKVRGDEANLNLESLPEGFYMMQIRTEGHDEMVKVVKR